MKDKTSSITSYTDYIETKTKIHDYLKHEVDNKRTSPIASQRKLWSSHFHQASAWSSLTIALTSHLLQSWLSIRRLSSLWYRMRRVLTTRWHYIKVWLAKTYHKPYTDMGIVVKYTCGDNNHYTLKRDNQVAKHNQTNIIMSVILCMCLIANVVNAKDVPYDDVHRSKVKSNWLNNSIPSFWKVQSIPVQENTSHVRVQPLLRTRMMTACHP